MQRVQLYVNSTLVDLYNDENIFINDSIKNVRQIDKVFTPFSQTFTIPASKTNNKIFQHFYNDDIDGYDARRKQDATIEINNLPFRKGRVQLNGVDLEGNKPTSYRITFFGNTVTLKEALGDDELNKLTSIDEELEWSASNVRTELQTTGSDVTVGGETFSRGYCCPLISGNVRPYYDSSDKFGDYYLRYVADEQDESNYDGSSNNGSFVAGQGYGIGDKIFLEGDVTVTVDNIGSFGTVTQFTVDASKNIIGSWGGKTLSEISNDGSGNGNFSITIDENNLTGAEPNKLGGNLYYNATSYSGIYYLDMKLAIRLPVIIKAIEEDYGLEFTADSFIKDATKTQFQELFMWLHNKKGLFDELEEVKTLQYTGFPTSSGEVSGASMTSRGLTLFNSSNTYSSEITISSPGVNDFSYEVRAGATVVASGTGNGALNEVVNITHSIYFTEHQIFITAKASDQFQITWNVINDTTGLPVGGEDYVGSTQTVSTVYFNLVQQMPNMKILDFLTGIFKMFNLVAYVQDDGKIRVIPLDQYYEEGTDREVTKYIDTSKKSVDVSLPFREINFDYAGRKTILAEKFEQIFGDGWGSENYIIDNDFNGEAYDVEVPFEHVQFERLQDGNDGSLTDILVGWIADDKQEPYLGEPILFYTHLQTSATAISFVNSDTSVTSLTSYLVPCNSLSLDNSDVRTIHFSVEANEFNFEDNNESLFAQYYENYITDVFNQKSRTTKVTAYFPPSFLTQYGINDRLFISNKPYKINTLKTNITNGKTQLELMNDFRYQPSEAALLNDLIVYYDFNEASGNLLDQVGSNDGTPSGVIYGQTGILNDCYLFEGVNDLVNCGNITDTDDITAFTASFWFKQASQSTSGFDGVMTKGLNTDRSWGFSIFDNEGDDNHRVRVLVNADDETVRYSNTVISTAVWYHVVVTWNGATGRTRLFINGVEDFDVNTGATGSVTSTTQAVYFGVQAGSSPLYFNGNIDEAGFWKRELNDLEIETLYGNGTPPNYSTFT